MKLLSSLYYKPCGGLTVWCDLHKTQTFTKYL